MVGKVAYLYPLGGGAIGLPPPLKHEQFQALGAGTMLSKTPKRPIKVCESG